MDKYKGKPTLIVNVATNCGFTKNNYKQLNELYDQYEGQGLRIAAFPCNQFGGQEPGCDVDIKEFIKKKGVRFDMYSKVDVNGKLSSVLIKRGCIPIPILRRRCYSALQMAQIEARWNSRIRQHKMELY